MSRGRAQANVVGVALLVGVTVVSMGLLTAGVGTVVDSQASRADVSRVARHLDATVDPVRDTGVQTGTVEFVDGDLRTVERDLRVLNESAVVARERVNALVFDAGDGRRGVTVLNGAVVDRAGTASFRRDPPVYVAGNASDGDGVLVVGAAVLDGDVAVSGRASVDLRLNVTHSRQRLGNGSYRVAIETETPRPWADYFERLNATVTRADRDGDGVASVIARFDRPRTTYLAVHRAEVRTDG